MRVCRAATIRTSIFGRQEAGTNAVTWKAGLETIPKFKMAAATCPEDLPPPLNCPANFALEPCRASKAADARKDGSLLSAVLVKEKAELFFSSPPPS